MQIHTSVLNWVKMDFITVDVLNSVIDSEDELILSTSHRFRFNITEWIDIFKSRGINAKHISIIDIPLQHKHNRKTEITDWIIKRNLTADDIVIIDDDQSLNELPNNFKGRLVLTNSYTGLNSSSDLKKILSNRKGKAQKKSYSLDIQILQTETDK